MSNIIILLIIILIYWTIPGFIQKYYILNKLTPFELTVNVWIISGIIGILLFIFVPIINNKYKFVNNKHVSYNFQKNINYFYIIFGILLFGVISNISYYYLLNKTNERFIKLYLNPLNIILVSLISHFVFNQHISKGSAIGIAIIILGIIVMYYFQ
tara:strand:- start:24 stop:491 length:468 start_codon:yes stop_codon:yes gene_type:complete